MHITCDCLNIIINSSTPEFLSRETFIECLPSHNYFKEDVALLCLCSITIQMPSLIKEMDIGGDWKIFTCINCGQACYSTSKNLASDLLIVKRNLEKETSQINALKQSDIYSPIFKIIIYNSGVELDSDFDLNTTLYPSALTWLSEQTAKAEERIKIYSEKEYIALDEMRKRAYKDQIAIIRKEKESMIFKKKKDSVEDITKSTKVLSITQPIKVPTDFPSHDDPSLDAEGVFLLEEFESINDEKIRKHESDSEGSDNELGINTSRKSEIYQLAKSLPIPVPQFMTDRSHHDPASGSPRVPSDIAASIRALAKSVHGDAIFGELPRPRFSTNL